MVKLRIPLLYKILNDEVDKVARPNQPKTWVVDGKSDNGNVLGLLTIAMSG